MEDEKAFEMIPGSVVHERSPWPGVVAVALALAFAAFVIATFYG